MTVCLIGVLKQYLKRNALLRCATQWRLATKPQTEKGTQNSFLIAYFSSTLFWLWEKSPDIWQKVSVVKKHVFLESPALWARRRSFNRRAAGREKDVVEAKLCKVTSVADVIWTGLTLTVFHQFFLIWESQWLTLEYFSCCLVCVIRYRKSTRFFVRRHVVGSNIAASLWFVVS